MGDRAGGLLLPREPALEHLAAAILRPVLRERGALQQDLPIGEPTILAGEPSTFERDGASFQCLAVQSDATGNVCSWTDADTVGLVFARAVAVDSGVELPAAVRAAVV